MKHFMLRVKQSALTEKEGVFFYNDVPFTGVAFLMNDNMLESANQFSDGNVVGEYLFEHFHGFDTKLIIDDDLLEPEDEDSYQPFMCFDGDMFTGVSLEFEGDFCTAEYLYVEGWSDSSIGYYPTGHIEAIEIERPKFSQTCLWYKNGQVERFEISYHRQIFIKLSFNEDGTISVLSISDDYFNQVKLLSEQLLCRLYRDDSFVDNLKSGDFLYIGEEFVDDGIFERIFMHGGFDNVKKLFVSDTKITEKSVFLLKELPMLENLSITSTLINAEVIRELKLNDPECYIKFNDKEILL
ncbi:hypothetical protein SBX64_07730 [Vibrio rhizosphaerae]|uniref:Uncharacterized protein n=1 Tax=Vibrio rhizosphaerae TaxID=398736 RepID=A0ABU4IW36_9VIBR|nr:hypothetical protein [Vibrio rhizosphaerae]MDW6092433.1 hypothetical protein [Vibrio rhizosphaerae]